MELEKIKQKDWWSYLEEGQKFLMEEALLLLEREEKTADDFKDYAFVVFPAAKAYEGFLKKLFFDLKLINLHQYEGEHFRIGKALNPGLPGRYRDEDWIFDILADMCQDKSLPQTLWDTWKKSRNLIFHWFPKEMNFVSLDETKVLMGLIIDAMDKAFGGCKVKFTNPILDSSCSFD